MSEVGKFTCRTQGKAGTAGGGVTDAAEGWATCSCVGPGWSWNLQQKLKEGICLGPERPHLLPTASSSLGNTGENPELPGVAGRPVPCKMASFRRAGPKGWV